MGSLRVAPSPKKRSQAWKEKVLKSPKSNMALTSGHSSARARSTVVNGGGIVAAKGRRDRKAAAMSMVASLLPLYASC